MEGLRDIKGLVDIPDYSWSVLLLAIVFMVGALGWLGWIVRRKKKILTPQEKALLFLQTLNIEDAKACAYALSQVGMLIVDATNKLVFEALKEKLDYYKYRPYNAPLSKEEIALWQAFLGQNNANI